MKYSYYSFAISRLFQCLFCSPVSVQFTSYGNLKTSSSQVLTGSCSDCRIPVVIWLIDLVSPQYWAQAAEYCNSGQKKANTAAGSNHEPASSLVSAFGASVFLFSPSEIRSRSGGFPVQRLGGPGRPDFFRADQAATPRR